MVGQPKIHHQSAYLNAIQKAADNISNPNTAANPCTIGPSKVIFVPPLLVEVDILQYHPLKVLNL